MRESEITLCIFIYSHLIFIRTTSWYTRGTNYFYFLVSFSQNPSGRRLFVLFQLFLFCTTRFVARGTRGTNYFMAVKKVRKKPNFNPLITQLRPNFGFSFLGIFLKFLQKVKSRSIFTFLKILLV